MLFSVLFGLVLPASVLALVVGGLTSLMLRQHWGLKVIATDAVFASALALAFAFVLRTIYDALGSHATSDWEVALTISSFSVAAKHLVPPALRSSNG